MEIDEEQRLKETYLKKFKENLYNLRGNIPSEKFAERIGMSRDFVEKKKLVDPKLSTLIKICIYLDISLDDLVGLNVRREPLNAKLEVKTMLENLFLAYKAANLYIQEDSDTGQILLVNNNQYIKEFLTVADERNAETMDDIRSLYSELYGDKCLFMYEGDIVEERAIKKLIFEKYLDYYEKHAHFNDYEGTIFEEDLIEKFNNEYEREGTIEKVIKWGRELDKKHRELIDQFYGEKSKHSWDMLGQITPVSEWKLVDEKEE